MRKPVARAASVFVVVVVVLKVGVGGVVCLHVFCLRFHRSETKGVSRALGGGGALWWSSWI